VNGNADNRNTGNHPGDDRCCDLIMGLLSGTESDALLRHFEDCPSCEERFRQLAADWETSGVLAEQALLGGDRATDAKSGREGVLAGIVRIWQLPRLRLGFAVALAVMVLLLNLPAGTGDRYLDLLTPLPGFGDDGAVFPRSGDVVLPDGRLDEGLAAYNGGEFDRAVESMRDIELPGPAGVFRDIYFGSALAMTGAWEEAVGVLETVPYDLVPEPWSGEARWTFYVALRGSGCDDRAATLLREIAGGTGDVAERARALLEEDR
jgi:hypothetical protein